MRSLDKPEQAVDKARDQLIVALDLPNRTKALALVESLEGTCLWFKVGMELFYAEGRGIIDTLTERGYKVFLDLKLHDIPNTVAGAVRSLEDAGASLLTVHAGGGAAMLQAAQGALRSDRMRLLAVTTLTSMDAEQLRGVGVDADPAEQVMRLARLASGAGIHGFVCSAEETLPMRSQFGPDALIVVPGIRPDGSTNGDQRRVATPAAAIRAGASMLVVGRPIVAATSPLDAAQRILAEISNEQRTMWPQSLEASTPRRSA